MSWEYVALAVIALIATILIIFRKNPYVKKYWAYSLILAPLVILIVLKIITDIQNRKTTGGGAPATKPDNLGQQINNLKDDLIDAQMHATAEIAAAKAKNEAVLKELEEVKKITDRSERRKRYAALIG
jgi:glucan phosphoethanolaminetransferase (alkaline phosphatase superfamily)